MSVAANGGSLETVDLSRIVEDFEITYNVLSVGEGAGSVENYTLIPVDSKGFVVVESEIFME